MTVIIDISETVTRETIYSILKTFSIESSIKLGCQAKPKKREFRGEQMKLI